MTDKEREDDAIRRQKMRISAYKLINLLWTLIGSKLTRKEFAPTVFQVAKFTNDRFKYGP